MTQIFFVIGICCLLTAVISHVAHRDHHDPAPVPMRDCRPAHLTLWNERTP